MNATLQRWQRNIFASRAYEFKASPTQTKVREKDARRGIEQSLKSKIKEGANNMNHEGWQTGKPTQDGLYRMRPVGSRDGGRAVGITASGKYKPLHSDETFDLPEEGYEYRPIESGYGSSY